MNSNCFVFTVNSRVVWIDDTVFHIPVLSELYRFHVLSNYPQIDESRHCTDYVVPNFVRFEVDSLNFNPPKTEVEKVENLLTFEKIRIYKNLCKFINESYQSTLPPVFYDENDKIDIVASSFIASETSLSQEEVSKHNQFIHELFRTKKEELKKRYIETIEKIKSAHSLEEIQQINFSVVYRSFGIV